MRLLSANMLVCIVKNCINSFPLQIVATSIEKADTDFNPEFILHILPRLEWNAFINMAKEIGVNGLPDVLPENITLETNADLLSLIHTALLDVHVQEGAIVCKKCNRQYPISQGIPNMLLNEHEV